MGGEEVEDKGKRGGGSGRKVGNGVKGARKGDDKARVVEGEGGKRGGE